nr:uncharacterized protein LOC104086622 [Nicotiana tomentosiformis]
MHLIGRKRSRTELEKPEGKWHKSTNPVLTLQEVKGILEKAMDIQERRALKAPFRQKKMITATQQHEEREAQFKVVRDHERRGFDLLIQGLRDQIGGVESSKECQIAEFEIKRHHYQSMINRLEGESLEIRCQRDMALECEHDALDLAETHGQQNQELHLAQEHIKGKILEVATYTSRACMSCQGMTPERFAEVSINVARHISADLERIYRDVGGQPQE